MLLYMHALGLSFSTTHTHRNTKKQEIRMVSTSIQNEHLHELETEQKPQAVIRAEAAGLPSSRSEADQGWAVLAPTEREAKSGQARRGGC